VTVPCGNGAPVPATPSVRMAPAGSGMSGAGTLEADAPVRRTLSSAETRRSAVLKRTHSVCSQDRRREGQSCSTTVRRELFTLMSPLYSMNPSLRNLFMKKFTRERVVPTIRASSSCGIFGIRIG